MSSAPPKGVSDYRGKKFFRLLVMSYGGHDGRYHTHWCLCDCGNGVRVRGSSLTTGNSKSCGCYNREQSSKRYKSFNLRHGRSYTPTHRSWVGMRQRCYCKSSISYPNYGGRGIQVCERWRFSFENFLADMGERPPGKTLDRIDGNGNYEPGNCRWATPTEQSLNRRDTTLFTRDGITDSLHGWAKRLGLEVNGVYKRFRKTKNIELALRLKNET